MNERTFTVTVTDKETGEYLTTHVLGGDDLGDLAELIDMDTMLDVHEIDLDNLEW